MARPRPPAGERGAALLTVLILVAVIAVLAATALEKLRLSTRLGGNAVAIEQARGFAYAAEALAIIRIGDLLERSQGKVSLLGGWSDRPFALPLGDVAGGGSAVARVTDGGNCFNLNGLAQGLPGQQGVLIGNAVEAAHFAKLMRLLGIPGQVAQQVATAASDWIDSDQNPQGGGAEDPVYLARDPPYRTGGALMADVSELRMVSGVTPEIFAQLRPWLCTLPEAKPTIVNINTLEPEQAPLVAMAQIDTISPAAIGQALLRRPPQGYADASAFWAQIPGASGGGGVATTTRWFNLRIDVGLGSVRIQERALVDATRQPPRLVARVWGEE
ncbi:MULTISPECIES: type II secretion system minor pseudopilin GspK [Sphingomonas]|jgi:general secretion pathway protein K|uniref:Type II secretion system protein K n=1 Tax=Sphingomonas zeae TaxID=1646122 RepID=A0A7Y6EHY2_9SPHN|nr:MULTISPECIES: type II secretion system minor pseudopilin GspK [Sphingomonas]MBB4048608.1 general secretion pathway protein K [Sphingomonas zeae]MDK8186498.1 type II secretion system minor pseudopilin GspK [Sphingomonas zeae]MDK8216157.1 type II secretion system minor pseudopilin GspK [Sphingomonas sp. UMB7805-LC452B]NUU47960.1 type II secretion system minor pseudopilin GspK [Sphingomonas zeae]